MAKSNTPINPKEYLLKSKFYKGAALVFVVLGLVIFMILYVANIEGHMMEALKNPFTIFIVVVPFMPAAVLSLLADKNEKKYFKSIEKK